MKFTVDQLREECEKHGLVTENLNRDQLRAALCAYLEEQETEGEQGAQGGGSEEQLQYVLQRLEHDRLVEQARMDHEYRMRQLEVESARPAEVTHPEINARCPRIPCFSEGEDVEIYLATFERIATANEWSESGWAPKLAALLTGKARLM